MINIWFSITFCLIYSPIFVSALLNKSIFLDFVYRNVHDYESVNKLYQSLLRDAKNHRSVDTVESPIDVKKIRSKDYDEDYLKNSVRFFIEDQIFYRI